MITFKKLGQSGRLGNQLWQLASTLGIAAARNEQASFPPWAYQEVFSCPGELFTNEDGTDASEFVPHLPPEAKDYLQDYNLWRDIAPTIREYLKPSKSALEIVGPLLPDLERPLVSVHVRRGDNATAHLRNEAGFHPLRPTSYYTTALAMTPPGTVVCFSDDIPWCRENINADYFFEGGPARPKEHEPEYATAPVLDWIDLLGMTMCDFHIMSNSSYSWWGAWLANSKQVIYPAPFFGPKLKMLNPALMMPDEWIELRHAS